jgi:chromosome segregation ATPase
LSTIIETKNNDIESWRVRFEEQESRELNNIDILTSENNQYRQNNECLEFDLKKCIEQEDILKDTCFDLEKILEERKAETSRLEKDYLDSISNLENLLKEERTNCDKTQAFLSKANNRIHALSTEIQEEHRYCEKLNLTIEEIKGKNGTLSHELNEEIKRFNMTHKALDDANNTISRLSMEHNELIIKLDAQTKDNGYLVEELNCLTNDCKNLEIVNGNLTLQIEKFTRQVADLKDENESFKDTIRCNEDQLGDQSQQLVQSRNAIQDFEFDCEKLRNALSDSDNVIKDLNYEIERLYIAKTSQENKTKSVLVSDVKINGNITEKEGIIIDGEINGNVNAFFFSNIAIYFYIRNKY